MRYDPRALTGIPTEPVGSLPRPAALQQAYLDHDAGRIDRATLEAAQESAVRQTIRSYEATGAPIISDGEQRRVSFATYPVTQTPGTTGLAPTLDPDGQILAIFEDGHGRRLPRLARGPFAYANYAADQLATSIGYTTRPMKQAVISPSTLALLYPLRERVPGYSRDEFETRLVDECERDIRSAFEVGAARVSVDFTEGRLATRDDPRNPWTGAGLLPHFIELINAVMARFDARERAHIGVHTCAGADRDTAHSADVPYPGVLAELFRIDAGYFLIQLAAEPDRDTVCAAIGEHLRTDAHGVTQMAYLGVVDPRSPRVESPWEIADTLTRAADFIPAEQLGSTDDCGFSPFSNDEKPRHGSPDIARGIAFRKIKSRVEGTRLAAEKLGIA
ncbi:5-methyltetrahydropteroyltriglutamate--homocysteine methyltransferase [Pseudonocardia endophytica]|uniref:Methionine synthase II (Cobalamin-independent) n=1 Tax=Pseudonocardia endophytica TaxID=401976 RepID=A0A4R1HGM3_PSEEN|nr:5-methyltetrahydropteroyltriglutamate--homocysteine methyltransferase [Pseudonocardia endophytica]TCK21307.1 methionine synthase II (cobalamin-independent) [Pseudonocardia endophytica]